MRFLKKKKSESLEVEVFDNTPVAKENNVDVATIEVRDIKQYLVDEFQRTKDLVAINETLEKRIEHLKEIKVKYDASLVLLDEYKGRIDSNDERLKKLQDKIYVDGEKIAEQNEIINTFKIKFNKIGRDKEELEKNISNEIIKDIKQNLKSKIAKHKGTLSKKYVLELIEELK